MFLSQFVAHLGVCLQAQNKDSDTVYCNAIITSALITIYTEAPEVLQMIRVTPGGRTYCDLRLCGFKNRSTPANPTLKNEVQAICTVLALYLTLLSYLQCFPNFSL